MSNLTDIANLELVFDSRLKAKFLSWLGWRNANIAEALGENENTIASWKARDKWDKAMGDNRVEQALQIRLMTLVMKEKKILATIKSCPNCSKITKNLCD